MCTAALFITVKQREPGALPGASSYTNCGAPTPLNTAQQEKEPAYTDMLDESPKNYAESKKAIPLPTYCMIPFR